LNHAHNYNKPPKSKWQGGTQNCPSVTTPGNGSSKRHKAGVEKYSQFFKSINNCLKTLEVNCTPIN
jgi:hypothetical protein